MAEHYDGIVIGAGQAGGPLSTALANAGWKIAMIEREHAGGTCVNDGCTPTKLMAATARVAYVAGRAEEYGVHTGPVSVDMERIRERKREIVESWRSGSRSAIEGAEGVTYYDGEATFVDAHTIAIKQNGGSTIQIDADKVFINTGQRARIPPIDGLEAVDYLTNKSIMELAELPEHLLVLGGGYIGLEFGQMFRRFGAEVTIIEASERFLHREDEDIAEAVQEILAGEGITVHTGAKTTRASQDAEGIHLIVETDEGEQTLTGSHLLVAVGRTPNSDMLNLDAVGVETDEHGYIQVDEHLLTNVESIYALGDVTGGPAFTHISYDDFRILRDSLLHDSERTTEGRLVPYTVFIDPHLAHVGLHEHEAEEQDLNYKVASMPMEHVARAIESMETRGLMKAVVDADTGQILGATILGFEGGEVMTVLQMAMMGNVPYTAIREGIFAHPLLAESLNNLFGSLE